MTASGIIKVDNTTPFIYHRNTTFRATKPSYVTSTENANEFSTLSKYYTKIDEKVSSITKEILLPSSSHVLSNILYGKTDVTMQPISTVHTSWKTSNSLNTTLTTPWIVLSMQNTVLLTVFLGCAALVFLVVCAIGCRILLGKNFCSHPPNEHRLRQLSKRHTNGNHYADPYTLSENHYQSNDVIRLASLDGTYFRPELHSAFISPSLYEEIYARWKLQEQSQREQMHNVSRQVLRQQIKDEKSVSSFKRYPSNLGAVERYNFERCLPKLVVRSASVGGDSESTETGEHKTTTF